MVRAKFKVTQITRQEGSVAKKNPDGTAFLDAQGRQVYGQGEVHTLHLSPVYGNGDPNHENSKFWAASPGGKLELNCVNPQAIAEFELGKEYYIDFHKAE